MMFELKHGRFIPILFLNYSRKRKRGIIFYGGFDLVTDQRDGFTFGIKDSRKDSTKEEK